MYAVGNGGKLPENLVGALNAFKNFFLTNIANFTPEVMKEVS
jgi:hypothetical protein